jgi:importin subunit beta-1
MEKPEECQAIMNSLMEATRSNDPRVRIAAYDGIVQVAVLYYGKLQDYMTTIYQLTTNAISTDVDDVAKAAIEFWTSLCEVEQDLIDEAEELQARGLPPETPCMRYVAAAVQHLVPILTGTLTKQEEDADDDDFTLQMAGQLCLTSVSQTVEDAVVPVIAPFVQQNIGHQDWHYRDAAILAFISMLEGPSQQVISEYVKQSVPLLLQLLNDPHETVRDSAAHCISRICLLHIGCIDANMFPSMLEALNNQCLEGTPKVASQAASAIFNLATFFRDQNDQENNSLSPYMQGLITTLLRAADRRDGDEANLRVACMEAISELISVAAYDQRSLLAQSLPEFISRFEGTFGMSDLNEEDKLRKEQIQGLLCAVIQSLYRQLDKATVLQFADQTMGLLLRVLSNKNASCQEECFSAVSAISDTLESDFSRYMTELTPLLVSGLNNVEAYSVCIVAVGTVGDISRNIEGAMAPYCNPIMGALFETLQNNKVHRSVKPPVLSCFGDIAMAIGGAAFQPYLDKSMMMLMQAAGNAVNPSGNEDLVDFINLLRESILEAFVGIIQGFRDGAMLTELVTYVTTILQFLQVLSNDPNHDEFVLSKAVGLLGDIAQAMGPVMPQLKAELSQPFAHQLINEAMRTGDPSIIETANWASSVLNQLMQS